MSEKLLEKVSADLLEKTNSLDDLYSSLDAKDFFLSIRCLIDLNKIDRAREILRDLLYHQNKNGEFEILNQVLGPEYFLHELTYYLQKVQNKNEVKAFIKSIKKSITHIENHIDHHYILYYSNKDRVEYNVYSNALLLNCLHELSDLLNFYDMIKEADLLFMIRNKIHLGYQRYFYHRESQSLISSFYPKSQEYFIADIKQSLDVFELISVDSKIEKKIILQAKRKLTKEQEFKMIIQTLKILKIYSDKSFLTHYNKYKKYLEYSPKLIVRTSSYSENIKKSLFSNYIEPTQKTFGKEKITLVNLRHLPTILRSFQLVKNE